MAERDPKIDFVDCRKPLTVDEIDRIEKSLNLRFPVALKSHYLKFNGGSPKNCIFTKSGEEFVVQEFFPMCFGPKPDRLESIVADLVIARAIIPPMLMPFADDPGGDYFCIGVDEKSAGKIYMFCNDYSHDAARAIRYLSKSLDDFLSDLSPDEE